MKKNQAWLSLHLVPELGAIGCQKLANVFGGPQKVFKASRKELEQIGGIRKKAINCIVENPPHETARKQMELAARCNAAILSIEDPGYPEILKNIYNPPTILYVKGNTACLKKSSIAIVGSRAATSYGLKVARMLGEGLARKGITVTSGLALGIDTAAHAGAVEAGGATVAVLGCGLDICYPQRNKQLAKKITGNGLIVSEYPFGTKPEGFRFPARNRIISGLSLGTVVVEAAARSGSLITAKMALDEGREVFAIPGRVDSVKSTGTHKLLQDGATLVNSVADILAEMPVAHDRQRSPEVDNSSGQSELAISTLTNDEKIIYGLLDQYPQSIDTIVQRATVPVNKVNETLLMLELKGLIEAQPGPQYCLK